MIQHKDHCQMEIFFSFFSSNSSPKSKFPKMPNFCFNGLACRTSVQCELEVCKYLTSPSLSKHVCETVMAAKLLRSAKKAVSRASVSFVCSGLLQKHSSRHGRQPVHSEDINGNTNTTVLIFRCLHMNENIINIIFHYCHVLPINPSNTVQDVKVTFKFFLVL